MAITITSVTVTGGDGLQVAYSADAGETRARVVIRRVSDDVQVAVVRRSFSGSDSVTFPGLVRGVTYRAIVEPLRGATSPGVTAGGGGSPAAITTEADVPLLTEAGETITLEG